MKTKKKKQLKQAFDITFRINMEEILDKKIEKFGSAAHIIMPLRHKGKKAKIIIYG